jgi:hypothetical protein
MVGMVLMGIYLGGRTWNDRDTVARRAADRLAEES